MTVALVVWGLYSSIENFDFDFEFDRSQQLITE
jgi:hypothetical protein